MRPARNASRPASTALRIALAISTGLRAPAMAVFISTPSQPSSIAIAASEAQVVLVLDAQARADRRGQRHHRGAADLFQALGQDRVVGGVDHHLEAILDQLFGGLEGLYHVRVQRLLVAEHFQLGQVVAVQQLTGQAAGAHGVLGGVAASGVGQDGVTVRRQHVQQPRWPGGFLPGP
ncbi:hypothetical protein G6F35_015721 [Rhizopus arrhizus]|nr:hypothetical protein G6F35_015721 [Rhizopus arrhizus]